MPQKPSNIPKVAKLRHRKRCKNCGKILDAIWFTAMMTEEWTWNGEGYNELSARHSLVSEPEHEVLCPDCEAVVGTGYDFGFGAQEYFIIPTGEGKRIVVLVSTGNF